MVRRFLSITFACCLALLIIGINGQKIDNNQYLSNTIDNNYSYGKLPLNSNGQNEELISVNLGQKTLIPKNEQAVSLQPLPTPCAGARPSSKLAHPAYRTKYIQCRDEFHYEIFQCPNNGEFDDQTKSCITGRYTVDLCEQEKPCLNDGECLATSNSTFSCTCRADWTGNRCEAPLNSCAHKPCGRFGECRPLKIADYQQDYVCVCNGRKEYGPNCEDVVPNPCTFGSDQYYPFAFNPRAYVQCDGEMIHIQPCGPMLFWNQEQRYCDRKRANTASLKKPVKKTTLVPLPDLQTESNNPINIVDTTTIFDNDVVLGKTNSPVLQIRGLVTDETVKLVPTRVSNRPQVPDMQTPSPVDQRLASAEFASNRMRLNQQQLEMQSTATTIRTPTWQTNLQPQNMELLNLRPVQNNQAQLFRGSEQKTASSQTQNFGGQNYANQQGGFDQTNNQRFQVQNWQQNPSQNNFVETTTLGQQLFRLQESVRPTSNVQMRVVSDVPRMPMEQQWSTTTQINTPALNTDNTRPQLISPQLQNFGGQKWSNQQGDFDQVNSQRFPTQTWQQNSNQGSFLETATMGQPIVRPQDLLLRTQDQSRPLFTATNNQLTASTELRTSSLPTYTDNLPETATAENRVRFNTDLSSQQAWQNLHLNSVRPIASVQPQRNFADIQRMRLDQQWLTTTQSTITVANTGSLEGDKFNSQQWSSQQGGFDQTNNQRFQAQNWQQNPNQNSFVETTTLGQPLFRLQESVRPTSNVQMRVVSDVPRMPIEQQWSTTTQSNTPVLNIENTRPQLISQQLQNFGGQKWSNQQGDFDQVNSQRFPTQTWQQNSNQGSFLESSTLGQGIFRQRTDQSLNNDASESIRSNQFTAQQTLGQPLVVQNSQWQEQRQPATQLNTGETSRTSLDAQETVRPNAPTFVNLQASSNGQFFGNIPETTTVTNNFIVQGSTGPSITGWRAMRTNSNRQLSNSASLGQQSAEARPALDSLPSSWRNRL